MKLVPITFLYIQSVDKKQNVEDNKTQHMKLFVVTYKGEGVLVRDVLHGLQPSERNKSKFIQVVFNPKG